jgi:hypothetical protein
VARFEAILRLFFTGIEGNCDDILCDKLALDFIKADGPFPKHVVQVTPMNAQPTTMA